MRLDYRFRCVVLTFAIVLSIVLLACPSSYFSVNAQTQSQPQQPQPIEIYANVSANQYVKVTSPLNSSINLLSVSGGMYHASLSNNLGTTEFSFTPTNDSLYKVTLRINSNSSNSSNFAYFAKQGNLQDIQVKNLTISGNVVIYLTINSTGPVQTANNWSPLFGLTGFSPQIPSLNFASSIAIVSGLGMLLIALGLIFRSKISYLGLVLLFFTGALVLGLLFVFGIIAAYVLSFALLNLTWRFRSKRTG